MVEPLALFGMAYLSYVTAELFHWSGIISLIGCGLVQAHYSFKNISKKSYTTVKYFIKMLSATSDCVIFLFLGIALMDGPHYWHTGFVVWTVSFTLICRFIGEQFIFLPSVVAVPSSDAVAVAAPFACCCCCCCCCFCCCCCCCCCMQLLLLLLLLFLLLLLLLQFLLLRCHHCCSLLFFCASFLAAKIIVSQTKILQNIDGFSLRRVRPGVPCEPPPHPQG